MIKRVDKPPYTIDEKVLQRFDERQTILARRQYDGHSSFFRKNIYENIKETISRNALGFSRIDFARAMASWTVHDFFSEAFSREKLESGEPVISGSSLEKYIVTDPSIMSDQIKETAKIFGASSVGITKLDRHWVYSHDMEGKSIDIPDEYEYAIVIAIAMDPEAIKTSPAFPSATATGLGYSHVALCVSSLAEFIRFLGYEAIPMSNRLALSIPLAIDAGLGESGRNGLLITPEHGPCVRLCKVFTNLPLEPDKSIEFGVSKFCIKCNKCAGACEAGAIQKGGEPSFNGLTISNNPGHLRYAIDHEKCFQFWIENGCECSTCISVCPWVKSTTGKKEIDE